MILVISRRRYCCLVVGCFMAVAAASQSVSDDPIRFARWAIEDAYAGAVGFAQPNPLLIAGGSVAVLWALTQVDGVVSREVQSLTLNIPRPARLVLHEGGNVKMIRPMAAALFLGSLTAGSVRFQDAAFTSLQSVVYANLITNGLKLVTGRTRPNAELGTANFRPFSNSRSFPSGHATTVMAFATPWLLYYAHVVTYVLAGLSVGTSLVRVADDYHWFTDVLAGAAIGWTTGYLLSHRHLKKNPLARLMPVAEGGGVGLRLLVSLDGSRSI